MKSSKSRAGSCLALAALLLPLGTTCSSMGGGSGSQGKQTLHGYVLDSACAFIKDLKKPVSRDCAIACARAGSPLVILADDGKLYWPISSEMPAVGQNGRLLEFAGERVIATGTNYEKGGSCGLVIDKIEREPATKP